MGSLSSEHPAYNPFGYHLGAVWPVDMGTFTFGLARYACLDEMFQLAEGLFAASDLFSRNLLPEVLGGMPRDPDHPHPASTLMPTSCRGGPPARSSWSSRRCWV